MTTPFNPHDPEWQMAALLSGQRPMEYGINTVNDDKFEDLQYEVTERARLGNTWHGTMVGMGLPARAGDMVDRYVRACRRVMDTTFEDLSALPLEKLSARQTEADERLEVLRVFFVRQMHQLGMTPQGTTHLLSLHLAWEQGHHSGLDAAMVRIQENLVEKPNNMTLLRYWLACLGALPVPSRGGGKRPKTPHAHPLDEPPTPDATPLSTSTTASPRPQGAAPPAGIMPPPLPPTSGYQTRAELFDEARALLNMTYPPDNDDDAPPPPAGPGIRGPRDH